jgi:uncharacterized protein YjiK
MSSITSKTVFLFLGFIALLSPSLFCVDKIKWIEKRNIKVKEPSDICIAPDSKCYTVSDDGYLFELDNSFQIVKKADWLGYDSEGVFADVDNVYVMNESVRFISIFERSTLKHIKDVNVPYSGGRNSGFEALTYNPIKKAYITVTEKNPTTIFELDNDLRITGQIPINFSRDVSAATFYKGFLYLLSDEDRLIIKVDPSNYTFIKSWKINVLNPEGIAFLNDGKILIVADDLERIYTFNPID